MDFLCTVLIKKLNSFPHLSSSDDTVVNEQKLLALDKFVNRYKLHLCNSVSHRLACWHKASGPCRSVLDERSCKRYAAFVCISYSVRNARIRYSANEINVREPAVFHIVLRHYLAVACSHKLHVHALIASGRVAVISPKESADLFLVCTFAEDIVAVLGYLSYLSRL